MRKASGMSDRTSQIILTVICGIILFIVAYPLYYVVVASFSDPYQVYAGKTFLFPSGFTLDGYKAVFLNDGIVSGFLNSVKYTVVGTIFSVVMLYITAYPLAQKDLPGRKALSVFFLFTMYFAGGLVPTYLVVKSTGLVGSTWSLFLPGGVGVGNMIIVRNYFQNSIPHDLVEAAEIDGCSKLRTFFSVVIPLSMPILAVQAVFAMVAGDVLEKLVKPLMPGIFALLVEAVVFGAIAWICYKKRPMEAVSQAVAFSAMKGPVKVLLMLLAGLLGSMCFCDISGNDSFLMAFSGLLLGVVFCQALLEIVYEGDLKAFGRHKKSFAAGALVTVFVYLFFALDIGGYDTWVPKQENVASAAIQIYFGNNYCYDYVNEKGIITWNDEHRIDRMEMTDVSGVLSLAGDGMGKDVPKQNPDTRLRCEVKYTLKNGKEKYRSFFIDYEREKTVLDILFANEEYKEGTNQVLSGQMDGIFQKSRIYYNDGLREKEVADKNALQLMRAYQQDLREMSFSDVKDTLPCGTLRLRYQVEMAEYMLEYPVFPSYTRTVEYLRGKNMELYLYIDPSDIESICFTRIGEEDAEIVEDVGFFGTTVTSRTTSETVKKEYTERAQIGEILGYLYPASLARWAYISEIMADDIIVQVQEADQADAWYYNWDENFMVRKEELPEFVRKDLGGE